MLFLLFKIFNNWGSSRIDMVYDYGTSLFDAGASWVFSMNILEFMGGGSVVGLEGF